MKGHYLPHTWNTCTTFPIKKIYKTQPTFWDVSLEMCKSRQTQQTNTVVHGITGHFSLVGNIWDEW